MLQYRLRWEDTTVVARVFDADLVSRAVRLLDLVQEHGDAAQIDPPDILVCRQENGYLLQTPRVVWHIERAEDLALCFVSSVSSCFLFNYAGTVLHAGAFVVNGEAVVFSGEGRSGKSALSLAALQLGYPVIGDDCVVIDNSEPIVRSFPKGIKLRVAGPRLDKSMQGLFSRDYLLGRLNGEEEYSLLLGRRCPNMAPYGISLPVRRLLLVERGMHTVLLPVQRNAMLGSVLDRVILPRSQSTPLGIVRFLEPLWRQKKVCRLIVGENDLRDAIAIMAEKGPFLPFPP